MKSQKMFRSAIMLALIAMLGISSVCFAQSSTDKTTMKEVKQEVQEAIQALKGYSLDQRDEAIKEMKIVLDKLDNRIDALETRIDNNWDKMNKAARRKARAALKSLRNQRTQLAEWYGGMKSSSADAWEDIKKGFSDAYTSFSDAWEKAEAEFGSSESGKGSK